MRKLTFIAILLVSNFVFNLCAQDQTINGNLTAIGNIIMKDETSPTPFGQWGKRLSFGPSIGENGDPLFFSRVNLKSDHSELRLVLGNDGGERLTLGYIYYRGDEWIESIVLQANGHIGIGVSDPSCALDVNGTIRSKEVKIEATGWADFVFDEDYRLPKLSEVENHIKAHKHLPDLPSEKQVVEEGINVVEMQAKLLQKIEELTLYVIEQDKENKNLQKRVKELEEKLEIKH